MTREPDELEFPNDLGTGLTELAKRFAGCPEPALVQASAEGVLPAEVDGTVRKHIENCPLCQSLARDLANLDEPPLQDRARDRIWARIGNQIAAETPPSRTVRAGTPWWRPLVRPWALAAAALAVVVVAGITIKTIRTRQEAPVTSNRLSEAIPGPTSDVTNPPAPSQAATNALSAFRLEKAPVSQPASVAMVWRGETDEGDQKAAMSAEAHEMEQALAPYRADKYAEAATRLERVAQKYPRLPEARFYLGVCQLFLNQNQGAVENLSSARGISSKSPANKQLAVRAGWYLALAYHRTGEDTLATPILEELCHSRGENSARACAALNELSATH
jgi:hypothetical protein